jgi:gas vesicle protein
MNKNEKKTLITGFAIGTLIGSLAAGASALLFAPYSGKVTREMLQMKGDAAKERAGRKFDGVRRKLEDALRGMNDAVQHTFDGGKEAADLLRKPSAAAGKTVEKILEAES